MSSKMDIGQLDLFIEQVKQTCATADEATRQSFMSRLLQLPISLENPRDTLQRVMNLHHQGVVCRIACDLNLCEILAETNRPMPTSELAQKTKCDPVLLSRIMRYLASTHYVTETDEETFMANEVTKVIADPGARAGLNFSFDHTAHAILALPEFLKETGYKNPDDISHSPFQKGLQTKLDPFVWLQQHPKTFGDFTKFMSVVRERMPSWLDKYPIKQEVKDLDPGRVLFVDVGGGAGHQCLALKTRYPDLPGRIILQDRPEVIPHAIATKGVESLVHDFFQPQPIKHAKYYYLSHVLHDWPDAACRTILTHLTTALAPDSCILIDEIVLPTKGAEAKTLNMDLTLMCCLAAMERTETQWRALLDGVGLRVVGCLRYDDVMMEAIQICVPK